MIETVLCIVYPITHRERHAARGRRWPHHRWWVDFPPTPRSLPEIPEIPETPISA